MPQKKRRKSRTIQFQIAPIFLAVMLVLLVSFSAAIYTSKKQQTVFGRFVVNTTQKKPDVA